MLNYYVHFVLSFRMHFNQYNMYGRVLQGDNIERNVLPEYRAIIQEQGKQIKPYNYNEWHCFIAR